jgi:hypothetical protein
MGFKQILVIHRDLSYTFPFQSIFSFQVQDVLQKLHCEYQYSCAQEDNLFMLFYNFQLKNQYHFLGFVILESGD